MDQVTTSYQSHEGAVNTGTSLNVRYGYDAETPSGDVFEFGHRLDTVTYPDGRILYYDYDKGNPNLPANRLSRLHAIRDTDAAGNQWTTYDYNGTNRLAAVDYPGVSVKLDYFQGTSGTYAGYDRFGRVKDQFWDGYNTTADVDRFAYTHDYAGNRTSRDITLASYTTDTQDHLYGYDGLHRLKTFDEGKIVGGSIATPLEEQDWMLDAVGNWSNFLEATGGSTTLNQTRKHNKVNEIDDPIDAITETTGPSWVSPTHDAAGNMTTIPQPAAPTAGYTATYDAWNRLVKLVDASTSNTVAEYEYDGLNRRIVKGIYSGGTLDHRRHFYYNQAWQALEVRKEIGGVEDPDPLEQMVWHPYYIDALATRFYDADTDGNLAENNDGQYYFTHDANFNVTAVAGRLHHNLTAA